ncbi:MAG: Radical SAM superfamily protein [candidate division BRC1 bacterium ADurb.BinA364]|nr:MAG: Radical SAM superfamily protein [candidate division BRC1 bacterium ADurb.BinA364]
MIWPSYLELNRSGELKRRAEALSRRYANCDLCPRRCGVDRIQGELGSCASRSAVAVASYTPHHGEEPPISGARGSGTIFFANCNLRCVYCQNHQISQLGEAARRHEISLDRLAEIMLELQDAGCHNINFVSPTHFVPSIVEGVRRAADRGLRIPLVYNTNAYDSVEVLRLLEGVIDIYMPDIKYADPQSGETLSRAPGYPAAARAAIAEMFRQTGELDLDEEGVARRGMLVRHLVLPGGLAGSRESLRWLRDRISPRISLSLMAQYYPAHRAAGFPPLHRRVSLAEYLEATDALEELGLEEGWVQSHEDAPDAYRPDFSRDRPFEL